MKNEVKLLGKLCLIFLSPMLLVFIVLTDKTRLFDFWIISIHNSKVNKLFEFSKTNIDINIKFYNLYLKDIFLCIFLRVGILWGALVFRKK